MYEDQLALNPEAMQIEVPEEIQTIKVSEYQERYQKVEACCLSEDSTVHCANGNKLKGSSGDFYVLVDKVHEFIAPRDIFKKLFQKKVE